jgi:hypothetical protein
VRTRDELIRDTEPFPDSVIEKLPPRGDNYVTWTHYAQRLLLYYGGYSWEPGDAHYQKIERERTDGSIYIEHVWTVTGKLTLGDEVYGAVGEDNSPTSAESNAFKRACAKAGIGLHLYEHYWLHNRLQKDD